jgi:catechol 2,3-dioxygenase-like lactoylglutathione lyase family enzyme
MALRLVIPSLSKHKVFRGARMDAMLAITGVAEIVLNVRDLPKMRDFYKEVLGFKLLSEACHETGPEPDADGDPTIAFLTIKEVDTPLGRHGHPQLLALIDFQRHVFAKGRFDGHEPTRSTLNHLAFEIPPESYEAHKERLEAFGLRPRPVTFPAMMARALFFDDPEQNVLELICHAGSTADYAAPTGHVTSED